MPKENITILAIETSADETSAAVLSGNKKNKQFSLKSNIVHSQIQAHRKTGGIVPEVAARAHIPKIIPVIKRALKKAHTSPEKINYVATTIGPGLITSLRIGVDTAKSMAFALGKPLIAINHLEGHLLSGLVKKKALPFPALGLIASGGHTMLVLVKNFGKYKVLGETRDDAAGEAFDKIAKILDLPYPGGPEISRLAKKGDPAAIDFPRPMLDHDNFQFSFAGLKTSVLYFWRDQKQKTAKLKNDVAASVEQAIVDVLTEKTIRAINKYKVKTVLLGGGVAANEKLRQTLNNLIKKEHPRAKLLIPESQLTTDNAGMIAIAAFFHALKNDTADIHKIKPDPNLNLKSWG